MNLVWIAGLAIFVLAERLLPVGGIVARAGGAVLIVAGIYVMFAA
jgi:predicted metal-binding membrane protein